MSHRDHRGGDGGIVRLARDLAHEAAIDLERIEREALEVVE
jgi:hypothetical protein